MSLGGLETTGPSPRQRFERKLPICLKICWSIDEVRHRQWWQWNLWVSIIDENITMSAADWRQCVSVCMYSSPLCRGLSNAYYESQTSQDNNVRSQRGWWSNFVMGQVLIHCRIQIRSLLIDSQKRFYNLLPLEDSVQLLYLHWTCAGWLPPSASLPQRAVSTISVIVSLLYLSAW